MQVSHVYIRELSFICSLFHYTIYKYILLIFFNELYLLECFQRLYLYITYKF